MTIRRFGRVVPSRWRTVDCEYCEEGTIWKSRYGGNDPNVWPVRCEECNGTGKIEIEEEIEEDDEEV
jgi:hypothetical protein